MSSSSIIRVQQYCSVISCRGPFFGRSGRQEDVHIAYLLSARATGKGKPAVCQGNVGLRVQSRAMFVLFIRVLSLIVWVSRAVCGDSVGSDYDLAKATTILEMFQHNDAGYTTIREQDLRDALDNCVTGDHLESLVVPLGLMGLCR